MPCVHRKSPSQCIICSDCGHGKVRYNCPICNDCGHGKIKYSCRICNNLSAPKRRRSPVVSMPKSPSPSPKWRMLGESADYVEEDD